MVVWIVVILTLTLALCHPPLPVLAHAGSAPPATEHDAVVNILPIVDVPAAAADIGGWDGGGVALLAA